MTDDVSHTMERRRLRRRVTIWRTLAFVAIIGALVFVGLRTAGVGQSGSSTGYIARVAIDGVITEDREQLKLLQRLRKNEGVKAVILAINSPGGTTTGGEALYEEIRLLADAKPVTAVFGTLATSAAYIVGLSADHIVARGNSITGSVGVIFQWAQVTELLDNLGVKVNEIKSGTLKAEPSPFTIPSQEAREVTRELIENSQEWFLSLVRERRSIDPATIPGLTEGRIFVGRQALTYKMIDAIGGEREAVAYLERERGIKADLPIRDRKPKRKTPLDEFIGASAAAFVRAIGLEAVLGPVVDGSLGILQRPGLMSIWRPS